MGSDSLNMRAQLQVSRKTGYLIVRLCRYLRSHFVYACRNNEGSCETALCACSPEPSLFSYAISSYVSGADLFILSAAHSYMPSSNDCCLAVIGSLVKKQTGSFIITKTIPDRLHKNIIHACTSIARPETEKNQCACLLSVTENLQ